jgi:hypothetical protein
MVAMPVAGCRWPVLQLQGWAIPERCPEDEYLRGLCEGTGLTKDAIS